MNPLSHRICDLGIGNAVNVFFAFIVFFEGGVPCACTATKSIQTPT
jgi:hypothetical protein